MVHEHLFQNFNCAKSINDSGELFLSIRKWILAGVQKERSAHTRIAISIQAAAKGKRMSASLVFRCLKVARARSPAGVEKWVANTIYMISTQLFTRLPTIYNRRVQHDVFLLMFVDNLSDVYLFFCVE